MKKHFDCPCGNHQHYEKCCKPYHEGALPENALILMRSRYSAYALNLADYIIQTTHPNNPLYTSNHVQWKKDILHFSQNTRFVGLKILEFIDGADSATVTFTAYLKQNGQDRSFTEKSFFKKVQGKWLYENGILSAPIDHL